MFPKFHTQNFRMELRISAPIKSGQSQWDISCQILFAILQLQTSCTTGHKSKGEAWSSLISLLLTLTSALQLCLVQSTVAVEAALQVYGPA